MTRHLILLVLACVASLLTGCVHFDVPDKFLTLGGSSLAWGGEARHVEAVAADNAQLRVRSFKDTFGSNLEFWCEALQRDLVARRGYRLLERTERTDSAGHTGVELTFDVTHAGLAKRYLACVFLVGERIRVVELTAPQSIFDEHVAQVRASIAKMR